MENHGDTAWEDQRETSSLLEILHNCNIEIINFHDLLFSHLLVIKFLTYKQDGYFKITKKSKIAN